MKSRQSPKPLFLNGMCFFDEVFYFFHGKKFLRNFW